MRRRALISMIENGHAENVYQINVVSNSSYGTIKFPNDENIFSDDLCFYICVSDNTNTIVVFNRRTNGNWDAFYCQDGNMFKIDRLNYSRNDIFDFSFVTNTYGQNLIYYIYKIPKLIIGG